METLWQDVTFGARTLLRSPAFVAVAVLTLALGIGANTAIFSVIDAVLLRPLPYDRSERLVFLTEWSEQVPDMSFSVANFEDLRDRSRVYESLVAYNDANFILTGEGGETERLNGLQVSSGVFATLGKVPVAGRAFTPEEDRPGAEPVALLGEGFWERRFGRDPTVVGRTITLGGSRVTVVGVMPGSLHGEWKTADVFTPLLRLKDDIGGEKNRGNHPGIYVVGRLKPGVSVEQARAETVAIAKALAEEHPDQSARQSMTVESLQQSYVGELRPALMLLLGAVALVLLIACANVANLLLARASHREREIAVRMAIGAGRGRVVRQLLTESVLLALAGALLGVFLAYGGVKGLVASLPTTVPRADQIAIDGRVLLFTGAIAVLTGLVFGIAPALRASRLNVQEPLREGGRGSVGCHRRLRSTLVVAEIALALVLLVGAGLLIRSFFRVLQADAGFRADGVLTASLPLSGARFREKEAKAAFAHRVVAALQPLPGVEAAAVSVPLLGSWQSSYLIEGQPEPPPGQRPSADITRVAGDYFRAMGVRVLRGRVFDAHDRADSLPVAVVDETFARTHFPGQDPLGRRLKFGGHDDKDEPWLEIVGVVAHTKNYGVDEASRVEVYRPYLQSPAGGALTAILRTPGDAGGLTTSVRQTIRALDPDVPVYQARPLLELTAEGTAPRRLAVLLITVFAAVALLLAAVGIYGVMFYAVTQRTQEIGVRMALGARREDILGMVLRSGSFLAAAGIGLGLVLAFVLARLITSLLFQTSASDPPTFSVVPALLVAVALVACYLPARRATRVDPMVALRYE